ncbi:hypothetical protein [Pseudoflavonifractor phocaeensis]|uniref:hypothetical protein n=1 Tax=Pseudoflavonifractor phocaeensis TaxID=1870988 RepID=UPI001F36E131|nr:hypothetical protein [Pseudoflavonifractor phocaeensis]MCF2661991.1 hypothetical protein [Pseudoflavonifractor phocaeensis]
MRLDKWLKVSRLIKRRTVFPQTRGVCGGPWPFQLRRPEMNSVRLRRKGGGSLPLALATARIFETKEFFPCDWTNG